MQRIENISQQVTSARTPKIVEDSAEWFGFNDLMGEKANALRKKLRPIFESGILNQIIPHIENATYPEEIFEIFKA